MQRIKIKGAIISNDSIKIYKEAGKEFTALKDINIPFPTEALEVIINSGGGDVYTGSEIYSMLREHQGHVTVKIVGIAASAASVIAMAGDTIEMSPTGLLMIHNAMGWTFGNTQEHEKQIKSLEQANDSIAKAYQRKTGLPLNEIRQMMKEETWFSCDKAIEFGFVDKEMFVNSISRDMVASILEFVPKAGQYEFIEKVVKKNIHLIKDVPTQTADNTIENNKKASSQLLTKGIESKRKISSEQKINIAKNAERLVTMLALEAKLESLKALKEHQKERAKEKTDSSRNYNNKYYNQGYCNGDIVLDKQGKTVIVADTQEEYERIVRQYLR